VISVLLQKKQTSSPLPGPSGLSYQGGSCGVFFSTLAVVGLKCKIYLWWKNTKGPPPFLLVCFCRTEPPHSFFPISKGSFSPPTQIVYGTLGLELPKISPPAIVSGFRPGIVGFLPKAASRNLLRARPVDLADFSVPTAITISHHSNTFPSGVNSVRGFLTSRLPFFFLQMWGCFFDGEYKSDDWTARSDVFAFARMKRVRIFPRSYPPSAAFLFSMNEIGLFTSLPFF